MVAALAAALPEWDLQMVGPRATIELGDLPQAPNLHDLGPQQRRAATAPPLTVGAPSPHETASVTAQAGQRGRPH